MKPRTGYRSSVLRGACALLVVLGACRGSLVLVSASEAAEGSAWSDSLPDAPLAVLPPAPPSPPDAVLVHAPVVDSDLVGEAQSARSSGARSPPSA